MTFVKCTVPEDAQLCIIIIFYKMAKEINTEIIIRTNPERVWAILTSFKAYPTWNPFIISIEGTLEVGNLIKVRIKPPESKEMAFAPRILVLEDNQKLSWKGKVLFSGIFDGLHSFELIDNKDGTTTFKQTERFTGILVWLFDMTKTKKGFEMMNQKLKKLAEEN